MLKLIKILHDKVQIKTDHSEFPAIRINDLIAVSDDAAKLITSVISITDNDPVSDAGEEDDIFENIPQTKVLECSIIGSVCNGKFSRSIERYPSTDVTAKEVDAEEFKDMLKSGEDHGFCIGEYAEYQCPAWVDGNKFFQRHACIVGNTGSGKSETVAKILEETGRLPGANIIVFDIHGEYSGLSYARNIKLGVDFHFPIWMFGFTGMVQNILKVREESSSVVMSALRKCYYNLCPDGRENRPVYFDFDRFVLGMKMLNETETLTGEVYKTGDKKGTPKTVKGEFNGKLSGIINTFEDKKADKRYEFLFTKEEQGYLETVIRLVLENDKPVKNIDLSDIPHDVAIPIIGVITKLVYDVQRASGKEAAPVTLVCDEAHVYIPTDFQLSASQRRMVSVFEEIAKEGRKFGVTLFPASQRPSELNKTIMAQCANFIVSKLNNENDKSMIKGMLPDGSESVIDSTTTFAPGEVLIIGDAVPVPLKIKVSLASERPQSRTVEFWDVWKAGAKINLEHGLKAYMN